MTDCCINTTIGTHKGVFEITMEEIILPEFSQTKRGSRPLDVDIFDAPNSCYDIIIGRNLLRQLGFLIDFTNQVTTWDGVTLAMQDRDSFSRDKFLFEQLLDVYADDSLLGENFLLESGYIKTDLNDLFEKQTHLTPAQWQDRLAIWSQCTELFSEN
jgi:hypothetical protein